jgi:hypothetical protein
MSQASMTRSQPVDFRPLIVWSRENTPYVTKISCDSPGYDDRIGLPCKNVIFMTKSSNGSYILFPQLFWVLVTLCLSNWWK